MLPLPTDSLSFAERQGWTSMPLGMVRETFYDGPRAGTVVDVPLIASHGPNPESYVFEPAGTSLVDAVRLARSRASQQIWPKDAKRHEDPTARPYNSLTQAVLQAADGAYYVTSVTTDPVGTAAFGLHGTQQSNVEILSLHENVKALVTHESWVPAPGVAETLGTAPSE